MLHGLLELLEVRIVGSVMYNYLCFCCKKRLIPVYLYQIL